MVKMLVGQGVGVEKRNAARLTSYDVATDHVIRQFLLPLQLRVGKYYCRRAVVSLELYRYDVCWSMCRWALRQILVTANIVVGGHILS